MKLFVMIVVLVCLFISCKVDNARLVEKTYQPSQTIVYDNLTVYVAR